MDAVVVHIPKNCKTFSTVLWQVGGGSSGELAAQRSPEAYSSAIAFAPSAISSSVTYFFRVANCKACEVTPCGHTLTHLWSHSEVPEACTSIWLPSQRRWQAA